MKILPRVNKNILIAFGIGIVVVFLAGRFLFFELGNRFKLLNSQTRIAEAQFARGMEIKNIKGPIRSAFEKYQPYLKVESMEKRQLIEVLLKEIESLAKEVDISIVNLSPQDTAGEAQEAQEYKADLRAEGGLPQVINFLSKVQDSKLLIKIDKMSLFPKDDTAALLKMEATLSVVSPRAFRK
jgi:hypothetical protein